MNQSNRPYSHAVVIGASIGGLLAARALADHFEQVTIVERDRLLVAARHRKGVPQSKHTHALLSKGREVLEAFFPGLTDDLIQHGATTAGLDEGQLVYNGHRMPKADSGLRTMLVSRPMLEAAVRARVLALPNVRVIDNADALGLFGHADPGSVKGVHVMRRAPDSAAERLDADLVVDASGRGSRAPQWLEQMGYPIPRVETVRIDGGYCSRLYRWTPDMPKFVNITPARQCARIGALFAQEDNTFIVTLAGYFGDCAPTDNDGFLDFAKSLAAPDIFEVLRRAEPITDAVPARFPGSVRRRYDRLARLPAGFITFGDAICSFNPVYGQGMTVAALEAIALGECMREGLDGLPARFYKRVAKIVETPWRTAVNNDLRNPRTQGKRTPMTRFLNWYVEKLHRAASHDPQLLIAFQKVTNMILPPQSLLTPAVVWRVLKRNVMQPKLPSPSTLPVA